MQSSTCFREASKACFNSCCLNPFPRLTDHPHTSTTPRFEGKPISSTYDFIAAAASSLKPNSQFSNHESLPSLEELFSDLNKAFPQYSTTKVADMIRAQEYYHLQISNHICLDYIGHGLFSYSQKQGCHPATAGESVASTSSAPPQAAHRSYSTFDAPFFEISYKSVTLSSQLLYGGQESVFELGMRKRIMKYMNILEDDYFMVFTANHSSAFKLLADSYPFESNHNLISIYDHDNEALEAMVGSAKRKGAQVTSAEFSWPSLRISSRGLRKMIVGKGIKAKKGLFVFPHQSKLTGARYSCQWMTLARDYGWDILLDATALGAKDMDTLGLSLFQPDFIISSFFKVFGDDPSGFACLFVKKTISSELKKYSSSMGIISLVPAKRPFLDHLPFADHQGEEDSPAASSSPSSISSSISEQTSTITSSVMQEIVQVDPQQKQLTLSESLQLEIKMEKNKQRSTEDKVRGNSSSEMTECKGLDHADEVGLMLISSRARYLINWLVNALMSLEHPNSEKGHPLVRIYGPKIHANRGPALAFNVFDWKGEKVDPILVQKLADRNNISLSCGFLQNIWFSEAYAGEKEKVLEKKVVSGERNEGRESKKKRGKYQCGIHVITASIGFLANFEDMFRMWEFVAKFLDADFVEKERWRYRALNQTTVEV